MPYKGIFNKKAWTEEVESISDTFIEFINKLTSNNKETELDIILTKKYRSNNFLFTGQDILDSIQNKLSDDKDYKYEFRIADRKPIVKRTHRISFDDQEKRLIESGAFQQGENAISTIEDLKAKYIEATIRIDELKEIIEKKIEDNFKLFKDIIEVSGGLYAYVSHKKLILVLSKILKEYNLYDSEKGVRYSFEGASKKDQDKVISDLFERVYK